MVDATGVPMHGRTPFMDKNSAVYTPPSISFGFQPTTTGVITYGTAVFDVGYRTVSKANASQYSFGAVFGNDSGYTFNDDGFGGDPAQAAALNNSKLYDGGKNGQGLDINRLAGRNSTHVKPAQNEATHLQGNDYLAWKNTSVGRTETSQADETSYPWIPCASYVPSQWPDFQPCTLSGDVVRNYVSYDFPFYYPIP